MVSIKQTSSGAFQLSIKSKLPPTTLWATFDTREQAESNGRQLYTPIAQGIVPAALLVRINPAVEIWNI